MPIMNRNSNSFLSDWQYAFRYRNHSYHRPTTISVPMTYRAISGGRKPARFIGNLDCSLPNRNHRDLVLARKREHGACWMFCKCRDAIKLMNDARLLSTS